VNWGERLWATFVIKFLLASSNWTDKGRSRWVHRLENNLSLRFSYSTKFYTLTIFFRILLPTSDEWVFRGRVMFFDWSSLRLRPFQTQFSRWACALSQRSGWESAHFSFEIRPNCRRKLLLRLGAAGGSTWRQRLAPHSMSPCRCGLRFRHREPHEDSVRLFG
jgi:hypothetical protein